MPSTRKTTTSNNKSANNSFIPRARCTQQERHTTEQKATLCGLSLTEYILTCALGKELPTPVPDLNIDGYALLQGVVEQLEQLNQTQSPDLQNHIIELIQVIRQLRRDLIGLPPVEKETEKP